MNYLRYAIGLQETGSAGEAVTVRSPLLAVARFAVDLIVRAVARDDGVESLSTVPALEALSVPGPALGEDLFRRENHATTTRTSLAQRGLDLLHIYGGCFWRHFTRRVKISYILKILCEALRHYLCHSESLMSDISPKDEIPMCP